MSLSAGLEHIGGVSDPILGVQARFLEVAKSTVCDKGWVVVRAQRNECIAGHGSRRCRSTEARDHLGTLGNQSSTWQDHGVGQGSNGERRVERSTRFSLWSLHFTMMAAGSQKILKQWSALTGVIL